MKVLIAEDDASSRNILRAILVRCGYEVSVVCDGQEAWEVLRQQDGPKLAVLDWMMPGLDGVEVCRRVRSLNDDNPPYLIILTTRDDKADIVDGLRAGANDYIAKPYDAEELQVRIEVGRRMIDLQAKLHSALEDLSNQAKTDPLTASPNRRGILKNLETEMARAMRGDTSLWISILDIDNFKGVNDQFGHLEGDFVLRECIQRIQSVIRPYDSVGRLGGDEFLIIISAPANASPLNLFERIRTSIEDEVILTDGKKVLITVSQGVAEWNRNDSEDELIRKADESLYRVKESGRNRVEFYAQGIKGPS